MDDSHRLNDIFNNSLQMNIANNIKTNVRHIKVNIKIKNTKDWASFSVYAARKRDRDKESPHMKFWITEGNSIREQKKEYFTESFKQLTRDRLLLSWMNVDVGSLSFPNNWESGWSTYKTIIETKWALRNIQTPTYRFRSKYPIPSWRSKHTLTFQPVCYWEYINCTLWDRIE